MSVINTLIFVILLAHFSGVPEVAMESSGDRYHSHDAPYIRVPAPALNSRPALKSLWISENWKWPWIVLEKEWKALKSL